MPQNDTGYPLWRDLIAGLGLLTRLPVPVAMAGGSAAWTWPVVGLVVALLAAAAGLLALALGLPPGIAAGGVLLVQVLVTGGLHEDGLADSADGLWGGHDKARRLEIMKDSRIGSYGVLALGLVVGMRWQTLALLLPQGPGPLVAAAVLSRAAMAGVMAALPPARAGGLARSVGQPDRGVALVAAAVALGLGLLAVGLAVLPAALAAAMAAAAVALVARARIGGQTGDILGAVQQVSELAVLLVLVALS
jgi:adenosylcobinamide-GDP ribazoletransferase